MPTWRTHRLPILLVLAAAVLAVHILASILLRQRSLQLTYVIAGLAYLPAVFLTWSHARSRSMRLCWRLWTVSLILEMAELLSASCHGFIWLYLPSLFQVVSFALCLLVVATPALPQRTRWIRATDILLAGCVCVLCAIAFLLPQDSIPGAHWLAFLTLIRLVPAVAALLAMRAAATVEEYTLMRFIALFQGMDFLSTLVLNQVMGVWLHQYQVTFVDSLLELPALGLALLIVAPPAVSFQPAGRSRFLVRSGLPLFFTLTILTLGLWLLPRSPVAGAVGIAAAILGYAVRSTLAQGRVLETEEQLRHSVAHLRDLADRDPLTDVGNRRAFDHILRHEWPHATTDSPLALILMDVDLFKQINDSMGHLYGDRCLRAFATVLEDVARPHKAHVCRFGGDEFAVILPRTPLDQAVAVADRICAETRALALRAPGNSSLTVSVGVAASCPVNGHTISNLIASSDESLRQAKQSGRDRAHRTAAKIPLPNDQLHALVLRVAALALRAPLAKVKE